MPIQVFKPDGFTLAFDSDAVSNGVCLGVFYIPSGGTFSKSFSSLVGTTVKALSTSGTRVPGVTVAYPGGVPTVSAGVLSYDRELVLWATGSPTYATGPGVQAVTPAGAIALHPTARGMALLGWAYLHSFVSSTGGPNNTGPIFSAAKAFGYALMRINAPSRPIGVIKLQAGRYVVPLTGWFEVSPGLWQVGVRCFDTLPAYSDTSWPSLLVPEVLCFAAPTTPSAGTSLAIWDTDGGGELAYELMAGQLLNSDGERYFPYTGDADSYSQPLPAGVPASNAGLVGSPCWQVTSQLSITSENNRRIGDFEAAWTLIGNNIAPRGYLWRVYRTDYDYSGPPEGLGIYAQVVNLGVY